MLYGERYVRKKKGRMKRFFIFLLVGGLGYASYYYYPIVADFWKDNPEEFIKDLGKNAKSSQKNQNSYSPEFFLKLEQKIASEPTSKEYYFLYLQTRLKPWIDDLTLLGAERINSLFFFPQSGSLKQREQIAAFLLKLSILGHTEKELRQIRYYRKVVALLLPRGNAKAGYTFPPDYASSLKKLSADEIFLDLLYGVWNGIDTVNLILGQLDKEKDQPYAKGFWERYGKFTDERRSLLQAVALYQSGKLDMVINLLLSALRSLPEGSPAWRETMLLLTLALSETKQFATADAILKKGAMSWLRKEELYYLNALVSVALDRTKEAQRFIEESLKISPTFFEAKILARQLR